MMNVKRTSPRLSRTESRALTRAALLAAGAEVFAERGYHRAAVEDIAERAGFTRGAFYANFRDKADLFLTLLDEQSAHNLDALDQLVERDVEGYGLGALARRGSSRRSRSPRRSTSRWQSSRRWRCVTRSTRLVSDSACATYATASRASSTPNARRAGFAIPIPSERFATMIIGLVDGMGSLHRLDPEVAPADLLTEALLFLGEGLVTHAPTPPP